MVRPARSYPGCVPERSSPADTHKPEDKRNERMPNSALSRLPLLLCPSRALLVVLGAVFGSIATAQTAHFSGTQITIPVPVNTLAYPYQVAVDGSGNVYIADYGSCVIFGTSPGVLKETPSANGYTESTIGSGTNCPYGVAVDSSGNVYISDTFNNRVLKETPSGGSYTQTVVADAANNGLYYPAGVAVDSSGSVYIADTFNSRVVEATTP